MSAALIILVVLAAAIGIACLLGVVWMLRTLRWEVVEDDQLHDRIGRGRGGHWFTAWFRPRSPMLTYRRDERGRFRRYRR